MGTHVGHVAEISAALRSGRGLVWVHGDDEDRLARSLEGLCEAPLARWDCLRGLAPAQGADVEAASLLAALRRLIDQPRAGLTLLLGAEPHLGEAAARWALREAAAAHEGCGGALVVLAEGEPPAEVEDRAARAILRPPSRAELADLVAGEEGAEPSPELISALAGLSLRDARHALRGALAAGGEPGDVVEAVLREKAARIRRAGVLEFVPPGWTLEELGGLDALVEWLGKRRDLFSTEALEQGLPVPRGILLMGVSGCGKSSAAKATSTLWNAPLFRLDLNLVFSGLFGTPEAAFHRALSVVESAAPAVLWVDELENGLSAATEGSSQQHLFSAFLTWMQEKPALVFVAATANRVDLLPPEVLRRGRFDQVFFCDLPDAEARREIAQIHLRRAGADPAAFDLDFIVTDTEAWTGAEIEQAIVEARIDARAEGRDFTTEDVCRAADALVPLSRTMFEQIRDLREWSRHRATPASGRRPQ
ncbi:MAG TPA: hypothetical protein DEA08_30800 [Planctomycetes bacterium]|nr:hypothetical protein [Planctomycetota bacterium]